MKLISWIFLLALIIFPGCKTKTGSDTYKADVIVYGGTASAVATAVQVSRLGRSVIIVSPDKHIGGMSSSGLGFTDTGNKEVIGGIARDPSSGLLPRMSPYTPGENGTGDNKIQAYCYRLCLTTVPENKIPITRPEGYDSTQYEPLARLSATRWNEFFNKYDPIPNLKTDVNNHGPVSFDNIRYELGLPRCIV
jgi:hypothetical protein